MELKKRTGFRINNGSEYHAKEEGSLKGWKIALIVTGSAALIYFGVSIALSINAGNVRAKTYEEAQALVKSGSYEEAEEKLRTMDDAGYKDTEAYLDLCRVYIRYKKGDIAGAYHALEDTHFKDADDPENKKLLKLLPELKKEYYAELEKQRKEAAEAYENKVKNGVPFAGMSESDIAKTSLGAPSKEVRHNKKGIRGEFITTNIYDFYDDGHYIFSAVYWEHQVQKVFDYRDEPLHHIGFSGRKSSPDDPYDAKSYSDEEDFYYDHYDDFCDFEDAEDYYREHS